MAKRRKAKTKPKHMPKTIARRRAVVTPQVYSHLNKPVMYVSSVIKSDTSRATKVELVAMSKPYRVACEMAAAAGIQSPDLTTREGLSQWTDLVSDQLKIVQERGVTVFIERDKVEAAGVEWGDQSEYLMYEDIRRYVAWCNHEIYELKLEEGRHCNTCRRTHYPQTVRVGLFYGKDRKVSGLHAAIPSGYYVVTPKGKI